MTMDKKRILVLVVAAAAILGIVKLTEETGALDEELAEEAAE